MSRANEDLEIDGREEPPSPHTTAPFRLLDLPAELQAYIINDIVYEELVSGPVKSSILQAFSEPTFVDQRQLVLESLKRREQIVKRVTVDNDQEFFKGNVNIARIQHIHIVQLLYYDFREFAVKNDLLSIALDLSAGSPHTEYFYRLERFRWQIKAMVNASPCLQKFTLCSTRRRNFMIREGRQDLSWAARSEKIALVNRIIRACRLEMTLGKTFVIKGSDWMQASELLAERFAVNFGFVGAYEWDGENEKQFWVWQAQGATSRLRC